jgi:hypothetical protein
MAKDEEREAPGLSLAIEAASVQEEVRLLTTRRRKLMLAAQRGRVTHERLAQIMGRSKSWTTDELRRAREQETADRS